MEPLLIISLAPNKRLKLQPLDYDGSLLLRWQIQIPEKGVNPLQLTAGIEAEQIIPIVGFLPRGQWSIPSGDQSIAPLAEISYSPLLDWFITTPAGFKNSQLLIYPYDQPTYQIPYTGTTVSYTPPSTPAQTSIVGTPKSTPAAVGVLSLRSANLNFLNGIGTNNTNKTLWVLFSPDQIAASKPAIAIGAGGNFDIEQGYQGVIQGFIAPGGAPVTGSIDLIEFNAV